MAKKKPEADAKKGEEAKPKKGKKKLLIALVPVIAVAAFGYMTLTKKPASATVKAGPTTTVAGPILEETALTVNLRDSHYLQFTAALQVAAGKTYTALSNQQAIVLDILNSQAERFTEAQLIVPGGVARLKGDIIHALDQDWPGLVVNVFFEQFVMQ
jgi:flagellar basal body-associated protein FliL